MSMYKQFKTDTDLEKQGIVLDYGTFRVRVARMGGSNKKFVAQLEQRTKPLRRAIQADTVDRTKLIDVVREVFVDTVILDWETNVGTESFPDWKQGIEAEDGSLLEFNRENVLDALRNLPDLYDDLQEQAGKAALFRAAALEDEAKN